VIDLKELRARFARAVAATGGTGAIDAVFDDLVQRHGEVTRHYHTLTHVDACLAWLDWFSGAAEHPGEVELALWFHDAVYDARRNDNERLSAELARDRLEAIGVEGAAVERIVRHVEATERHAGPGGDSALVVDLDLSILGVAAPEFARFEEQIRREYGHVAEPLYVEGRRRVLEGFLARPEIYRVKEIAAELEARARDNLERRIEELSLLIEPR
jgi:predicted metal-dependent HD superfamily phosphohydrolase